MYGLTINDQEEYEATMCPICDEHRKDVGENECKFCYRKGKFAGFINMPTNQSKSISMQLLRENDSTLK